MKRIQVLLLVLLALSGVAVGMYLRPPVEKPVAQTRSLPPPPPPPIELDPAAVYRSVPPKIPHLSASDPCTPLHFGFDGNPHKYNRTTLAHYTVPRGRTWRFTSVSILAERHHGGPYAVAGEWTVQLGAHHNGNPVTVSDSSLDNGSGLALQGQGRVNATFDSGDRIVFSTWLRPYTGSESGESVPTDPANYYYTLGASGMDCPS
jgi:hypothetical protein